MSRHAMTLLGLVIVPKYRGSLSTRVPKRPTASSHERQDWCLLSNRRARTFLFKLQGTNKEAWRRTLAHGAGREKGPDSIPPDSQGHKRNDLRSVLLAVREFSPRTKNGKGTLDSDWPLRASIATPFSRVLFDTRRQPFCDMAI